MEYQYLYKNRAVAFLDVLGFQNKLQEFETEAIQFYSNDVLSNISPIYYSQRANDFINTFNSAISKLDTEKFSYYLFSDNICITAHSIDNNRENTLVELLLVISELYYEFIQKGYFLRGGIDYGLFIDKSSIALGVPLAKAYKMESYQAIFPRIILSDNFIKQLKDDSNQAFNGYSSILAPTLIKKSSEIQYLNVFSHIFKVEEKECFFEKYNKNIIKNLHLSKNTEWIFLKYRWLADEFNAFIETYTNSLAFYDENFEPTDEYIEMVKQFKIA